MPQQPVVTLGSGIAGLTLGHCLTKRGITSIIYEREASSPERTHGITLHEWACKPLLQVLPIDEHSFRRQIAVDPLYHAGTGKVHPAGSTPLRNTSPESFRANISKLEQLLRDDQNIKWEHNFTYAKTSIERAGSTILTFENTLQTNRSCIVDTLGVHSPLRKSLLPEYTPKAFPYVVCRGARHFSQDQFIKTYATHFKNSNILTILLKPTVQGKSPDVNVNVLLQIWVNDHLPNGDVEIPYIYSRPTKPDPDLLHDPHRCTASASSIRPSSFQELDSLSTHPSLTEPFLNTFLSSAIHQDYDHKHPQLLHWLMRILPPPSTFSLHALLYENGVTMIGDAVHAMPILGGEGANHP